ncbi:MFS transporter [Actinacidiphila glaucinigra]|uniref:Predicted arabinose efflux permease, MFS family n=1 Tax=Actinacidiphila glaucinigra TaxID=235986 RepID=A0A239DR50_9ACTN|nr:MFS transporter [Actinacidiphila glaucinigra]SNS34679.1 Predicted arabinose efflux permease, MFS family [Actinacidiphila glaucinigra]
MHTQRPVRRMPRPVGFWLLAATLLAFLAASSAPSPLYVVYQHQWGFSPIVLTTVFAVYVLALLVALLTVGGLSDHVGRRPVLLAALVVEAAAMVVFLAADGVGALFLARVLQGVATGAAAGAISAGLIDLQPSPTSPLGSLLNTAAPATGLAAGALGAGLLVEYAPAPTRLVFVVLTAVFVVLAALVLFLPDPVSPRPGAWASLRPRAAVPAQARRTFLAATPCLVATWAMGGLYLALGPSLTAGVLHLGSHLVGGLVVTTLFGVAAVASLVVRDVTPQRMMTGGSAVLAAGTGLTLLALAGPSTTLFFVGTGLAGFGFGAAFLGAFRSLAALARPTERAELFASVYVVSYLALSVPAVLAGLAVPSFGLHDTAMVYGAAVVLLALLAAVSGAVVRRPAVVLPSAPAAPAAPASAGESAAGTGRYAVPAAASAPDRGPGSGS